MTIGDSTMQPLAGQPLPLGLALLVLVVTLFSLPGTVLAQAADGSERGLAIYRANACGVCHHFERAGSGGIFGPPQDAMAAVAEARIRERGYGGTAATAADYVRESILAPQAYLVPGYQLTRMRMPSYSGLSEQDLHFLVDLLLGQ